eukprot:TRINITY_DN2062_c0_g1_i6.p1 TRINITY_DN2062_c0_g1~~TRINITY_DN2062_c0_g1_i6.p1  ORF type:complete len:132 (+),score=16.53 TRINITY_DN2062_c0_g1_i6:22-396(+)
MRASRVLIAGMVLFMLSDVECMRLKRDLTCAVDGNRGCNITCKLRGWKDGSCSWNTETAAYNCNCSQERRGIRCNVGGENTCHYSCVAMGHTHGSCDQQSNCECSGVNNRLGDVMENIAGRLRK